MINSEPDRSKTYKDRFGRQWVFEKDGWVATGGIIRTRHPFSWSELVTLNAHGLPWEKEAN